MKYLRIHSNALEVFDSVEEIHKFFDELSTNTSLESLSISGNGENMERMEPFEEIMLHGLLPLFANNINLQSINFSMNVNGAVEDLTRALIEVCPSLTSIALTYNWLAPGFVNTETAVETICRNSRLQHISIKGNCLFSTNACLALGSLLAREDCALRCLVLTDAKFDNDEYSAIIAHGLSRNKSLKRLKLRFTSLRALGSFIKPLHNQSIEKISLSTLSQGDIDHDDVTAALRSMIAIQSINLRSLRLPLKPIISIVSNSANLRELVTDSLDFDEEILQKVVSIIPPNSSFKVLILLDIFIPRLSITGLCSCFNYAHKSRIEKLCLRQIPGDFVMLSLCIYLASNRGLQDLEIQIYSMLPW